MFENLKNMPQKGFCGKGSEKLIKFLEALKSHGIKINYKVYGCLCIHSGVKAGNINSPMVPRMGAGWVKNLPVDVQGIVVNAQSKKPGARYTGPELDWDKFIYVDDVDVILKEYDAFKTK